MAYENNSKAPMTQQQKDNRKKVLEITKRLNFERMIETAKKNIKANN